LLLYVLYGLFILACIVLIIAVLLQPGKAGAGDLFTSNVSSTAFGPRGTQTLLAKITIGAAAAFMLIALMLSLSALSGQRSVLQSAPADTAPTPQAAPAAVPPPATTSSPAAESSPAQSGAANTNAAPANTNANASASPAATKK
jgi:preprotein translocase subunit SecG